MRLGETNPDLRIVYLTIYTEDGSALATDAAVGMVASDLLKAANDDVLVDAEGTLEHIEDGLYKYTATLPEALVPGFLALVFVRAGYSVAIAWANVGPIFSQGETDPTLLRLPITIFDEDGLLVEGATVALASQLRTNVNGSAFADVTNLDPADSLVEVGRGLYYIQGMPADAAIEGARGYKFEKAGYGTAITWVAIAPTTVIEEEEEEESPTPILVPITETSDIGPVDHVEVALSYLPQQFRGLL